MLFELGWLLAGTVGLLFATIARPFPLLVPLLFAGNVAGVF